MLPTFLEVPLPLPPKGGREKIIKYNDLIFSLMLRGYGVWRIYDHLVAQGINISMTTIQNRMIEMRKANYERFGVPR